MPVENRITERDLVAQFKKAYTKKKELEESLKTAEKEFDKAESAILELLESMGAETTARYDGLGYVRQMDQRLYASYTKENTEEVFSFVKDQGRDDLITPYIHPSKLSTFVKERIELGAPIPETITYYFKKSARLFGGK